MDGVSTAALLAALRATPPPPASRSGFVKADRVFRAYAERLGAASDTLLASLRNEMQSWTVADFEFYERFVATALACPAVETQGNWGDAESPAAHPLFLELRLRPGAAPA